MPHDPVSWKVILYSRAAPVGWAVRLVTVVVDRTVVVLVVVFVACPTAKNRLAEIRTLAITIAAAITR